MKNLYLYFIDVLLILLSIIISIILRDNFDLNSNRLMEIMPYFVSSFIVASLTIPAFGINRQIWRFSTMQDYFRIIILNITIIIGSVAAAFLFNRLDSIPRSLPLIHFNISCTLLIGFRILYKFNHFSRRDIKEKSFPLKVNKADSIDMVLLIGLSRLTEIYLKAASELGKNNVNIVGILGNHKKHVGRTIGSNKILGTQNCINEIIFNLKTNGIEISKIVVSIPEFQLTLEVRKILIDLIRNKKVEVIYLSDRLGFGYLEKNTIKESILTSDELSSKSEFEIQSYELEEMTQSAYWPIKRTIDFIASFSLLILASPLLVLIVVFCFLTIGRPILFWQQRPGLGGRPFNLYKFRSMKSAYTNDGQELTDEERVTIFGNFLRRTRFDEFPQLFNILRGDMSFIGPRPLLPRDQDKTHKARLLIRPGLTGWAQVVGGRAISAEDKAALDIWYVKKASLALDLKVVLKTIPIIILGETISRHLIEQAWIDLRSTQVLDNQFPRLKTQSLH